MATTLATVGYLGAEIYGDLEASRPALNWAERRAPAETTRIFARDGRLIASLYLDNRSYWRKIHEIMLARKIEAQTSKADILERYLNHVYFGAGAHGIGAAASGYFGVQAKDLSAAQSALLAGLLQAPAELSPFTDRKVARHRQVVVLARMRELGYLDQASFRKAIQEARTMKFRPDTENEPLLKYPYFTSFAIYELAQSVDQRVLYEGGLRVYTPVDSTMRSAAETPDREGQ